MRELHDGDRCTVFAPRAPAPPRRTFAFEGVGSRSSLRRATTAGYELAPLYEISGLLLHGPGHRRPSIGWSSGGGTDSWRIGLCHQHPCRCGSMRSSVQDGHAVAVQPGSRLAEKMGHANTRRPTGSTPLDRVIRGSPPSTRMFEDEVREDPAARVSRILQHRANTERVLYQRRRVHQARAATGERERIQLRPGPRLPRFLLHARGGPRRERVS